MTRFLVAGLGAIGGWALARLTEAGAEAEGWARGETFERLAAGEPLVLDSYERSWAGPVRVVAQPDPAGYDVVLVCAKVHQTAAMAAALPATGVWVSCQNGLEGPDLLRAHHDRVVPAVVYCGVQRVGPVHLVHRSNGLLMVGDPEVAAVVSAAGIRCRVTDDIRTAQWQKLMGNVALNSVCAVTGLEAGPALAVPGVADLVRRLVEEVAQVAVADGAAIDDAFVETLVEGVARLDPATTPSTLQDVRAGRPLEVDAITGVVVRRAAATGVPVPAVATMDALLRAVGSRSAAG